MLGRRLRREISHGDRMKYTKTAYEDAFSLAIEQPWLVDKKIQLYELLSFVETNRCQQMVLKLTRRIFYLDENNYFECLRNIYNKLFVEWNLPPKKTQIVAPTLESDPDSGQSVIQDFKVLLAENSNTETLLLNTINKCSKFATEYPNIVLLDEFSGTGSTLISRAELLHQRIKMEKNTDYNLYIAIVAGITDAVQNIKASGYTAYCCHTIQKGIRDFFSGKEMRKAYSNMFAIEMKLKEKIGDEDLPMLGYGRAEALYYHKNKNVPNSVFPMYWWPMARDGNRRNTIMLRYLKDGKNGIH